VQAKKLRLLEAFGVTAYSRTRRITVVEETVKTAPKMLASAAVVALETAPSEPAVPVVATKPKVVVLQRDASTRTEFVIALSELARFEKSKMYRHLCLSLMQGAHVPVVENAVQSDTALHFEAPPAKPLKLGSVALLKSAWRARRQAWQAIRVWRKQNPKSNGN
jgi:hypothetical protein